MAFTMHSHSGQFCPGHAKDELEDIVKHAIGLGYTTLGLTEHMPRTEREDLYPEELDDPEASLAALAPRHAAYLDEAQRLQALYASQISILIGFEGEWIRPAYKSLVTELATHPAVDYFIGSLHHVNGIPIDFDKEYYARARDSVTGARTGVQGGIDMAEQSMYERYYDEQYQMLVGLRPRVVGHFDLVRLMSTDPGRDVRRWDAVWERIVRNLTFVASYGGLLECNTSALRKGLDEPYPCRAIAEKWLSLGGKLTLSDDSHGIAQVGTNYKRALDFLSSLGVTTVWTLRRDAQTVSEVPVPVDEVEAVVNKW